MTPEKLQKWEKDEFNLGPLCVHTISQGQHLRAHQKPPYEGHRQALQRGGGKREEDVDRGPQEYHRQEEVQASQ